MPPGLSSAGGHSRVLRKDKAGAMSLRSRRAWVLEAAASVRHALPWGLEFFEVDVTPLHGGAVGLELDGAGFWEGAFFVEEVVESGLVDDGFSVEDDGDFFADHFDGHFVPLADGAVCVDKGFASGASFGVIPEAAGAFGCAVF